MDWKESFNSLSAHIADLEERLRKARAMYAEWQINEKRMTHELLVQHDQIHALIEELSIHVTRTRIDEILADEKGRRE